MYVINSNSVLFYFIFRTTQISVSTASEIFCNFNGFFADVREKSESSKRARWEYLDIMRGTGQCKNGDAKTMINGSVYDV